MSDEDLPAPPHSSGETAFRVETTLPVVEQPNVAAVQAIDAQLVKRRGPGRPPKNPAPAATVESMTREEAGESATPAAPKKRNHGKPHRHKTRAELAAIVRAYKRGELQPGASPSSAPIADTIADPIAEVPAVATGPVIAGDEIRKEKFARGVARAFAMITRAVARRRGAHWQFDAQECSALGEASADCLEAAEEAAPSVTPYLQTAIKLAPFAVLPLVVYEIVDPRLEMDAKIAAGEAAKVMPAPVPGASVRVMP